MAEERCQVCPPAMKQHLSTSLLATVQKALLKRNLLFPSQVNLCQAEALAGVDGLLCSTEKLSREHLKSYILRGLSLLAKPKYPLVWEHEESLTADISGILGHRKGTRIFLDSAL